MKILITIAALIVVSISAEARNFYRTGFSFESTYTNIRTGSKDLFSDKVIMLFSDDGDFCYFQYKEHEEACTIVKQEKYDDPEVLLPVQLIKSLFIAASENHNLAQYEKDAVKRLINLFPNSIHLSKHSSAVRYQLHDNQPEAIHVEISGLSYPSRY